METLDQIKDYIPACFIAFASGLIIGCLLNISSYLTKKFKPGDAVTHIQTHGEFIVVEQLYEGKYMVSSEKGGYHIVYGVLLEKAQENQIQ